MSKPSHRWVAGLDYNTHKPDVTYTSESLFLRMWMMDTPYATLARRSCHTPGQQVHPPAREHCSGSCGAWRVVAPASRTRELIWSLLQVHILAVSSTSDALTLGCEDRRRSGTRERQAPHSSRRHLAGRRGVAGLCLPQCRGLFCGMSQRASLSPTSAPGNMWMLTSLVPSAPS